MPILTALALLFLLAGTFLLSLRAFVWDAALYLAIGVGCLVAAWLHQRDRRRRTVAFVREVVPRSTGGWVRVAALVVSVGVALEVRARPLDRDFTAPFLLWLASVVAFGLSLVVRDRQRPLGFPPPLGTGSTGIPQRSSLWRRLTGLRLSQVERWGLVALVVGAGLLRGVAVGQAPANLGGDEGTQLAAALDLVAPPLGNPFAAGWYSVPTMSFLLYGLGMRVFGATVAGGRMLSVIAGTLTVFVTFLFARTVGGRRVGWVAAAALAGAAYHIHFSRLASNQIGDPLIGALTLWLVWRALGLGREPEVRSASTGLWGLAGITAGLGWYGYFGARWVVALVALVVTWRAWADRSTLRRHRAGLALFAAGWLVTVAPLLGWYSLHPSALTERYQEVSIFSSGWLAREVEITGFSPAHVMIRQLFKTVTAFHLTPDPTFWYRPNRPLVDFVSGALILIGLVDAVVRARWPSRMLVHVWLWPTLLMAWGVTENPPSSQRGLLLVIPVVMLIAYGVEAVWVLLGRRTNAFRALAIMTLMVIVGLNAGFYFGQYVPSRVYGNPTAESATTFARYSLAHPEPVCPAETSEVCQGRVYFVGAPFLYWGFGTLEFMLRRFPGEDVPEGEAPVVVTTASRFAVVPERADELPAIESRYPGGVETELHGADGRLLMLVYDVGDG